MLRRSDHLLSRCGFSIRAPVMRQRPLLVVLLWLIVGAGVCACQHKRVRATAPATDAVIAEIPTNDAAGPPWNVEGAAAQPWQPDQQAATESLREQPVSVPYLAAIRPPGEAPFLPPLAPADQTPYARELDQVFVTSSRTIEPPKWRTSVRSLGCTDCDVQQVEQGKAYVLNVRLSNHEEGSERGRIAGDLREIFEAIEEGESTTLKLVPLFVNGIVPFSDADAQPKELAVLRPEEPGLWGQESLRFTVLPNAKKCASLVVSVWDVSLNVAHDAFLVTMPVSKPGEASRCPDPLRPGSLLLEPSLVSVSDVFEPPVISPEMATSDRIAIYAFELPIKRSSYVFAVIDPVQGDTSISGWKLKTPLSESFGLQAADFNKAAQHDRQRMHGADEGEWIYERTAKFIKKKLFTAEFTTGGAKPDEVFERLRTVINREGANANVMAQIFVPITGSDESGLMFLPLRTLAGANSAYFKDFRFASPLPGSGEHEDEATTCVSNWKLVLNTSLADSTGDGDDAQSSAQESLGRLAALEPKPWRSATMTRNETIREFFESQDDAEEQAGSTGIIIAAHYGRRSLGLDGDEITVEDLTAYRAPHSVAVLAACETAAPTEANGIIRGLRGQNVDAFLASPLRIPTDYAIRFVESLVRQIDSSYTNGAQPTLAELYMLSMDNVETSSEGQRVEARNIGREFVIVGDATRRLCRFPMTEAEGDAPGPYL